MKFHSSDLPSTLAHNLPFPFSYVQQRVIKKDRTQQWHNQQFYYPVPGYRHSGTWSECLWGILVIGGLNARSRLRCTASSGMVLSSEFFCLLASLGGNLSFFCSLLFENWLIFLVSRIYFGWRQGLFRYLFGRYLVFFLKPPSEVLYALFSTLSQMLFV